MKKLFLVRHAKSDWNNLMLNDSERPLNDRGYSNANSISQHFTEIPELIITSPAVRAVSTALIFARNFNYNPSTILIKEELYETSVKEYLSVIRKTDNSVQSLMLFAHNPIISDVADLLTKTLPMEMPTCCMAGIQFNTYTWKDIKAGSGNLFLFDYPKK